MKIKRASWIERLKDKLAIFIIRRTRVRYGPLMIEMMGCWIFLDSYGSIYRLEYTGDPNMPLRISVLVRT